MPDSRPNIFFIMSDDHAAHAISAYGSAVNETPNIDRPRARARFDNVSAATRSAPSRATILTGTHSHVTGVRTLAIASTAPGHLPGAAATGWLPQTAIFGKWHLGHGDEADPTGFDA